jgi:hypothetical protein
MSTGYLLWHWPRSDVARDEYQAAQRTFHATMAATPVEGYNGSTSFAVFGLPWANGGGDAFEDWYTIANLGVLDTLDDIVASGRRDPAHAKAASGVAGGVAGVYRARLGTPLASPQFAIWFNRPAGLGYQELFALLDPLIHEGEQVLWMRKLVLGPMEFCLQSTVDITLQPEFIVVATRYRTASS